MGIKPRILATLLIFIALFGALKHFPTDLLKLQPRRNTIEWMRQREKLYEERRQRVRSVCEKYERVWRKTDFPGREFLFDLKNGLAYCRHEKVSGRDEVREICDSCNERQYEQYSRFC